MKKQLPESIVINPKALEYEVGCKIKNYFEKLGVPIFLTHRVTLEADDVPTLYKRSKNTVFVTLSREKKLRPCRPSADYQFALSSSCPGHCEYCYLQTTQGEKPYIKIFVNVEDILRVIQKHIEDNKNKMTTFECSSITDPIPFEAVTGSLSKSIKFFGESHLGRLRLVTKYHMVDSLLEIKHNGHTTFRFSVNSDRVIKKYEHGTSTLDERIQAAQKVANAGYPIGFIVAPIMIYDGWKRDYRDLIVKMKEKLPKGLDIVFELIQHRYTKTAKDLIYSRFPNTTLDMNDEKRQLKWGPYGKFKYVYRKEDSDEIKKHISSLISEHFENGSIAYFT